MKERRRRKRSREHKVERSFLISYVLKWTLCINPIGSEIRTVGVKRPIQLSLWNRDRDSPILLRDQVVIQGCYIFLRFCPILTIRINRRYPAWDVLPFSSLLQDSSSLRIWQIISVCISLSIDFTFKKWIYKYWIYKLSNESLWSFLPPSIVPPVSKILQSRGILLLRKIGLFSLFCF